MTNSEVTSPSRCSPLWACLPSQIPLGQHPQNSGNPPAQPASAVSRNQQCNSESRGLRPGAPFSGLREDQRRSRAKERNKTKVLNPLHLQGGLLKIFLKAWT